LLQGLNIMPIKILMPALSPTMTEGTLAKWIKQEGDSVAAGDVMAEIETDKATMEVEAVDEGIIGRILVQGGTANVAVNDAIAVLLEEGESVDDIDSFLANDTSVKSVETPAEDKPSKVETVQAINKPTRNHQIIVACLHLLWRNGLRMTKD
jgi:pyruvate/2-oxoglutarate dehydrogenase complex dihydrolipoamide acyltransferase (E2) component